MRADIHSGLLNKVERSSTGLTPPVGSDCCHFLDFSVGVGAFVIGLS